MSLIDTSLFDTLAKVGFRPAREASAAANLFKTLVQAAAFWGVFVFIIPPALAALEGTYLGTGFSFAGQRWVAGLIFAGAALLNLYSGVVMAVRGRGTPFPLDTARELVVTGPYRFVRNPMAIGGLGLGAAAGVWLGCWLCLGYVLLGAVVWHLVARPPEERDLEARFGESYRAYRTHVRCWWPRRTPYAGSQSPSAEIVA